MGRLLIVGIDAATLKLVRPWAEQGYLPHLSRFFCEGAWGVLRSTVPPFSPAAWSTFATGKNPGKHGVLTFAQTFPDAYEPRFINASCRAGKPFWEIAAERGICGGIINLPFSYPPRGFNGFMVAGMLSPAIDRRMTSPPEIFDELRALCADYQVDVNIANRRDPQAPRLFLERALRNVENRTRVATGLYRSHRPPLFCVVYTSTDRVCHYYFREMERWQHGEPTEFGDAILNVYRKVDEGIGALLAEAGEDADVLVVSDHGAGPIRARLSMQRALARAGLLSERKPGLARRLLRQALLGLARSLPRTIVRRVIERFTGASNWALSQFRAGSIDFARTLAYAAEDVEGAFVNLRGRQPRGIVEPGEQYEQVRDRIIEVLAALTDPATGKRVARRVYRREELWHGPFVANLPDVVMEQADWIYDTKPTSTFDPEDVFYSVEGAGKPGLFDTGRHTRDGMLLALGPHIRPGELAETDIVDIPATALALLGCAVPGDFDGRVLTEMLTPDLQTWSPGGEATEDTEPQGEAFSGKDKKAVEDRLRGLGYI